MTRRAIVTGGAGFIGSHLVDRLMANGWIVSVIDDLSTTGTDTDFRSRIDAWIDAGVRVQFATVNQIEPDLTDVEAIFHLAGKVGPVGVIKWAGNIAMDTIAGSMAVARWASAADCPLIDISTSEVYGGGRDGLCAETMPRVFAPGSSARLEYAVGKLAAETALLNTRDVDARIVRPFSVAGPRQSPEGGFVVPRFVRQALAGMNLTVYEPGTQRRAFTHVDDIVDGILAVFERGERGGIYNLGNRDNLTTIWDLAMSVREAVASESELIIVDPCSLFGPGFVEAADKYPDASYAESALGWRATRGIDQVIVDVTAYWRSLEPQPQPV